MLGLQLKAQGPSHVHWFSLQAELRIWKGNSLYGLGIFRVKIEATYEEVVLQYNPASTVNVDSIHDTHKDVVLVT